jgi:hypothetical protein
VSDLGPAIVTGSVAIVVAALGFISTGIQAARTQRVQDSAALRDEKRQAYANCIAALLAAVDAKQVHFHEAAAQKFPLWLKLHPMAHGPRDLFKAETDMATAVSALALVAPGNVTTLAWEAANAVAGFGESKKAVAANNAVMSLLQAMREDLGYPLD